MQCVIECSLCSVLRAADWAIWFAIAPLTAFALVLLQCLIEGSLYTTNNKCQVSLIHVPKSKTRLKFVDFVERSKMGKVPRTIWVYKAAKLLANLESFCKPRVFRSEIDHQHNWAPLGTTGQHWSSLGTMHWAVVQSIHLPPAPSSPSERRALQKRGKIGDFCNY